MLVVGCRRWCWPDTDRIAAGPATDSRTTAYGPHSRLSRRRRETGTGRRAGRGRPARTTNTGRSVYQTDTHITSIKRNAKSLQACLCSTAEPGTTTTATVVIDYQFIHKPQYTHHSSLPDVNTWARFRMKY